MGECVDVRLRVCQDVQPGTELLMYEETVERSQITGKPDKEENTSAQHSGNCRNYTSDFSYRHAESSRFVRSLVLLRTKEYLITRYSP